MAVYNPLVKLAGAIKTGTPPTKAISDAAQSARHAGQNAINSLAPGTKAAMTQIGKYAAYPAAVGAGVGVGAHVAGSGIKSGFGFATPAAAAKTLSGVALFAGLILLALFAWMKVKG